MLMRMIQTMDLKKLKRKSLAESRSSMVRTIMTSFKIIQGQTTREHRQLNLMKVRIKPQNLAVVGLEHPSMVPIGIKTTMKEVR